MLFVFPSVWFLGSFPVSIDAAGETSNTWDHASVHYPGIWSRSQQIWLRRVSERSLLSLSPVCVSFLLYSCPISLTAQHLLAKSALKAFETVPSQLILKTWRTDSVVQTARMNMNAKWRSLQRITRSNWCSWDETAFHMSSHKHTQALLKCAEMCQNAIPCSDS